MQIWSYHPETGEYLGPGTADRDPVLDGYWLVPAYATNIEPPTVGAGYAAVFSDGSWSAVEDLRGQTAYDTEGVAQQVADLGPLPEGWSLTPPPPAEVELRSYVTKVRQDKLSQGFTYDFEDARGVHLFGTTPADRSGWDEVKAIADALIQSGSPSSPIAIRTDTGNTTIQASEWATIQLAGAQFGQPIWAASWVIKDEIESGQITETSEIDSHPAWP